MKAAVLSFLCRPHMQSMNKLKTQFTNPVELLVTLSDTFDLWLRVQFAGMSTRTCGSQQTQPLGFDSPQIMCLALAAFNSRAVPPGVPLCPQEMWSQEVTPPAASESVPVAGMEVRYWQPWASALPCRPHPPGFPACGELCQVLSVRQV